jgi:DNA recombination protein RmuC
MELNYIAVAVACLLGVLAGAVASWIAARSSLASAVEGAVTRAQSDMTAETAQLRERARLADETKREDQAERNALKAELDGVRAELDKARDEVARQTERALQVPELQRKVSDFESELRVNAAELLRVSQEGAQAAQLVTSLTEQLSTSNTEARSLRSQLDDASTALNKATGDSARLEEQAERVKPLEAELAAMRVQLDEANEQLASLRESAANESSGLRAELHAERENLAQAKTELASEKQARTAVQGELATLQAQVAELSTNLENERTSSQEKLALLQQARESLTDQFKVLANEILEEKSQKFADQNKTALGTLLEPLKTQLTDFKSRVEEVYDKEGKERSALAEQVRQLQALNTTLSQDAQNLTSALKGNAQTQGAWGELILETVLESSGLRKDQEYFVQDTQVREDGSKGRPDVVILLPQGRKLVVDSKVSLNAFEEYCSASEDIEKSGALKRHLASVKNHINGLSAREYQKMYTSLDFVLMFVPLEPAFMTAVAGDKSLFMDAWNRNVLLVSPSTLLFVVRTVAHLWAQEAQSRNALDIAKRGAMLYDKLVEFVNDLEKVGTRLESAKASYDEAYKRLGTGKGNIVWQAETLKQLGVKASKSMGQSLVERSAPDLAAAEELASIAVSNTPQEAERLTPQRADS